MGELAVAVRAATRRVLGRTRSHPATTILAVAGVASGVAALLVVLSVMNGLQLDTIEDIVEVSSYHLRIVATADAALSAGAIARLEAASGIVAVVAFHDVESLVSGPTSAPPLPLRVRLLPTDVARRDRGLFSRARVLQGTIDLSATGGILIGVEAARALRVTTGDHVRISTLSAGLLLEPVAGGLPVAGIFRTGYRPLDAGLAFASVPLWGSLGAPELPRVTYGIKLLHPLRVAAAQAEVADALAAVGWDPHDYRLDTWQSFNRAFFGALRVEKLLMASLVGLIFLVVSFGILQVLRRRVVERTEEIGLLGALGAGQWSLRLAFVLEGGAMGIGGSVLGTAVGLAIAGNFGGLVAGIEALAGSLAVLAQDVILGERAASAVGASISRLSFLDVPTRLLPAEVALVAASGVAIPALAGVVASRGATAVRPSIALRVE